RARFFPLPIYVWSVQIRWLVDMLSPAVEVRNLTVFMRQFTVILAALTIATFQMCGGILDWFFDAVNKDEIARGQAKFLVWDGVPHPFSARFEKVKVVDKDGPFYLFHVVLTSPGVGVH